MAEGPDGVKGRDQQERPAAPAENQGLSRRIRRGDEVASARADVELSRTRLTTTADTLQEKLEPRNLRGEAKDRAKEVVRDAAYELLATVRRNPLPSAAAAVAFGLLVARLGRRQHL